LQPFLQTYPEADLSLWCPVFYFLARNEVEW